MVSEIIALAQRLGQQLKAQEIKLATAESCTGGGIAQAVTEIPGSSEWFDRGFVTYSNSAKIQMLGVKAQTLACYGAVSAETAREMVAGALLSSDADAAVAVTGIAGPGGGSEMKPVGTVFIAWQWRGEKPFVSGFLFSGNRGQIRQATVKAALEGLIGRC
ncbi:MAG: damage-inducible protein CinA [Gammaproteobacteria bacterium HGW-Gammaproteobacteria-10]|nr:MAG: damage-inducible protein CinA [Gammaproteobacteria bacterium HGW-Gammaproteobacteria-3]PKM35428.1 MAG: damage-inducible protein CinA [Gammaproteobacteria bacterium HGW-Gammaproteobacteria-10]